jgi:hypothetical protein
MAHLLTAVALSSLDSYDMEMVAVVEFAADLDVVQRHTRRAISICLRKCGRLSSTSSAAHDQETPGEPADRVGRRYHSGRGPRLSY